MVADGSELPIEHLVSIVVPVYQGEQHLRTFADDVARYTANRTTKAGHHFRVVELILVNDCGPDDSPRVLRELQQQYPWVRLVWLSRNYGQHAATLAGMASSSGEWIATMDEDGQHDPVFLADMIDAAISAQASVVYADPTNKPPHSVLRNLTSRVAKGVVTALGPGIDASVFQSFRLVLGEVGRSVAAYSGAGVYLDVALGWVAGRPATTPVQLRDEGGERRSGYRLRTLLSHFWRMVLTGGTRGLRVVSGIGVLLAVLGFLFAVYLIIRRVADAGLVQGWTSILVVVLVCSGASLFSLGVIAEYLGVAVNMAMGKPPYLIVSDPARGPLGRGVPEQRADQVQVVAPAAGRSPDASRTPSGRPVAERGAEPRAPGR